MRTSSIRNSRVKRRKTAFHRPVHIAAPISSVDNLVRKLVAHAAHAADSGTRRDDGDDKNREVLFDAEFDGMRCLIVREPKTREGRVSCTPRECEIARMIAKGYPNKTIAAVLEISSWTVGTHLRHMFAKLGVPSRAAMIARMIEAGLIEKTTADWAKHSAVSSER
jgi:DNA-binding CsgD family transcriptional regulator